MISCNKCFEVPGSDNLLKPGQIIMIGEIHGTKEAPEYIYHLLCQAISMGLEVIIGLELPFQDQTVIDNFIKSAGDDKEIKKILELPFWSSDYQDGRASQAMLRLIQSIKTIYDDGGNVQTLLITDHNAEDRDLSMANRIIEKVENNPDHLMIILTGNFHNMIPLEYGQMGGYVLEKFGQNKVTSLLQRYTAGSAWVDVAGEGFGPIGLRGNGIHEIGIYIDSTLVDYHGTLEVDSIHHSRPANELLKNN